MRITLDFRNETPAHCDVAVFVEGALAGTITLRREECAPFRRAVTETDQLRARVEQLEGLLIALQNARPLLLYGDAWIQRINETLGLP